MDTKIQKFQDCFIAIHQCRVPVLMGAHKACIGAGVDFFSASDISCCISSALGAALNIPANSPKISSTPSSENNANYSSQ